ncbi:MAG: 4Fe-4S ferredoxin [Lentisphaerae bacterium]|nr:4Fe-4S ferredoxin [Lentisphaerota bacterium]
MKRLLIDLYKCDACEECAVKCDYFYRQAATDHGVLGLRERATFLTVCRRCEDPACVAACKFEALERQPDDALKRHNLRCVSCKCCSHACPFGTIYPETVPFHAMNCDFCVNSAGEAPPCTLSCAKDALAYREISDPEKEGVVLIGDNLAVRAPVWDKKKV